MAITGVGVDVSNLSKLGLDGPVGISTCQTQHHLQMSGVAQYLIALCNAAQDSDQSFGIAVRIGASDSKFKVEASKIIHSVLSFSTAPESVAAEFLNELAKVSGISHLGRKSHFIPARFPIK